MEFSRFDVIEAEIKTQSGSAIESKKRPYVVVGNGHGTKNSSVLIIMPLTSRIKKSYMPVHSCIKANDNNGLHEFSMILGELPCTIDKTEVVRKFGNIDDEKERAMINQVCYNTFFFGEKIDIKGVAK